MAEYDKAMRAAMLEYTSNYYSNIIDELGTKRKGIVGTKFMQIIEEPHLNPEWGKKEIEGGTKGARIDLPAFSAYSTVFGEQSSMIKEIQANMDTGAEKQWEYLKALQTVNTKNGDMYRALTEDLKTVDISKLKMFKGSTGSYIDQEKSLNKTVLDVNEFPGPFNLNIPTGEKTQQGTLKKEKFYIPGSAARSTYKDPLLPGEKGMDDITRRLLHLVNMAKELETSLTSLSPEDIHPDKIVNTVRKKVKDLEFEARGLGNKTDDKSLSRLKEIYDVLNPALSRTESPLNMADSETTLNSIGISKNELTEHSFINYPKKGKLDKNLANRQKTPQKAYAHTIADMRDVLIGKLTPEPGEINKEGLTMAKEKGIDSLIEFANKLGVEAEHLNESDVSKKIANLQKAKIDYYYALANEVSGKKGSIDTLMFGRKIPSIIAKATVAVSDKRGDLLNFNEAIDGVIRDYSKDNIEGVDDSLSAESKQIAKIRQQHNTYIKSIQESGTPVLKQGQLGVSRSMASKIPVKFKRAQIDLKNKDLISVSDNEEDSSLFDMMGMLNDMQKDKKYTQKNKEGEAVRKAVDSYISEEVAPFVESVRYPFTGKSSLVPYKPKLINDKAFGGMAENSVLVPGVTEGLEGLDQVIEFVQKRITTLSAKRETLQEENNPENITEIDKLTDVIRRLSAAISDVIPKYTAQAQKLDFDGDQIEIHSAQAISARKEIATHYEKFNKRNIKTDPDLVDVYRTKFLSDAAEKPTGPYVIGEAVKGFEKKFEPEKGFSFMKTPHITKDLEYLTGEQSLAALSGPDKNIKTVMEDIITGLPSANVSEDIKDTLINGFNSIQRGGGSELEYAEKLFNVVKDSEKTTPGIGSMVEGGVKKKLYEVKLSDDVEAQLFKIHTGIETEGLYRVHRLAETNVGFGDKNTTEPSKYFQQRYPSDLKSMGGNPAKEFTTMINEVLRFAIQKGMDVKHAGEKPLGGEITRSLAKGDTNTLWDKIQKDSSYKELKEFSDAAEETIKMRLGALPTDEIMKEAKSLISSRGEVNTELDSSSRKELISLIVEKVGFKGFLEELSSLIEKEAISGLIASEKISPEEAKKRVNFQKGTETGISIRTTEQKGNQPIYSYRSSMSGPEAELKKVAAKYSGLVPPPPPNLGYISDKNEREAYLKKHQGGVATAVNLQSDFEKAYSTQQGGAYAEMTKGAIDYLSKRQKDMAYALKGVDKTEHEQYKKVPLAERALDEKDSKLTNLSKTVLYGKNPAQEIKRLSELSGAPYSEGIEYESYMAKQNEDISSKIKSEIKQINPDISQEDFEAQIKPIIDKIEAKAANIHQLDRVTDVLLATSLSEEKVLLKFFGDRQKESTGKPVYDTTKQFDESQKMLEASQLRTGNIRYNSNIVTGPGGGGGGVIDDLNGASLQGGGGGKPVDVFVVGIAAGIFGNIRSIVQELSKGMVGGGVAYGPPPSGDMFPEESLTQQQDREKSMDELEAYRKKIFNPQPASGASYKSYDKHISPSALKGGGAYGSSVNTEEERLSAQLEELKISLTEEGKKRPVEPIVKIAGTVGKAVHAKIDKTLADDPNIVTEEYSEIGLGGGQTLGGAPDIIEKKDNVATSISDIKTVSKSDYEKIKKLVDDYGDNLDEILGNVTDSLKQKLEDYYSQLNAYLKLHNVDKGELLFYNRDIEDISKLDVNDNIKIKVKYNEKRFESDMSSVAKAREHINEKGEKFRQGGAAYMEQSPSDEELNNLMKMAKQATPKALSYPKSREKTSSTGEMSDSDIDKIKFRKDVVDKNLFDEGLANAKAGFGKGGLNSIISPYLYGGGPPINEEGVEGLYDSLKKLHIQATNLQSEKGVNDTAIDKLPSELQTMLKSTTEKGPDMAAWRDKINALREEESPNFTSRQFIQAWKLYRIAVGDYMVRKMDEAKAEMDSLKEEQKPEETFKKFQDLRNYAVQFQKTIKASIGKKTDIYTSGNRFPLPELAIAAGVYKSPDEVAKDSAEPIGEDPKMRNLYNSVVENINKPKPTAPIENAREMFRNISDMNGELASVLSDAEKFGRLGPEVIEAWDLDKLAERATRLRAAFSMLLKNSNMADMDVNQKKHIENTIKYLKNIEGLYSGKSFSKENAGYGQIGITPVPKFETPEMQKAMHARNIQASRQYFTKTEETGGPAVDERFTYQEKIVGESGETVKNTMHHFRKYGEEVNSAGEKVGVFTEKQQDLIAKMQNTNSSMSNAVKRVIMWGAASKTIYGGVAYLKSSLDEITKIESGMAEVRMVMNPMTTDFSKMAKSAVSFGKQYGVPVTSLIGSMKVFAQQGLSQEEVLDRTKTSTLASNVTTLSAKDATEALTAAMKVFREEGDSSIRMLDAWSEVEAKHAVTADDLANAIKKSALAAKTAGVDFDQLNGIVAAIGSTTRQTGNEVGTSLRFMFQRMSTDKGPKVLAQLNIPVIDESGEMRKGFDVLGDLAGKWDGLTNSQKMNLAQSIGGTRQYNSVLVLMDQWDEVLRGVTNSVNSKGSAERRNEEVMKTYAKQLEQTRVVATELKMEFGKIVLPVFKGGLSGLRGMFTVLNEIPSSVKMLGAGMALFITYAAKGLGLVDGIMESFNKVKGAVGDLFGEAGKQIDISKFEVFGKKSRGVDTFGLKTLSKDAADTANTKVRKDTGIMVKPGENLKDFHSGLGQLLFIIKSVGDSYNKFIGGVLTNTGAATEKVGKFAKSVGNSLVNFGSADEAVKNLWAMADEGGLSKEEVGKSISELGVAAIGALAPRALRIAAVITGASTQILGHIVDKSGEFIGEGGQKLLKDFVGTNASLVKSVAPLAVTTVALIPAMKSMYGYWNRITHSAQDYESSTNAIRSQQTSELKTIKDTGSAYSSVSKRLINIKELMKPEVKEKRQSLENYTSPLIEMQNVQKDVTDLSNQMASSNINLAAGYDKLGNAILKTTGDFRTYIGELERLKTKEGIKTDVDVLDKYINDLSNIEGPEKWKKVIKDLVESAPLVGDVIGKNIKMSPASVLDEATTRLNKMVGLKNKNPLSTAADADIEELQKKLNDARGLYQDNFKDFKRVQSNIVSSANLKSLSPTDITKLFSSETMKKAYELQIQVDPKFKLVKGIKPEDLMGKDILSALNPNMAGLLGANSKQTVANFESANIKASKGSIKPGDLVTFISGKKSTMDMAGQQAIVKYKKTADDVFEWVVQYFNTKTLKVEERSFGKDLEKLVDNIFPANQIKEDLSDRMDALNTFVTGAAAGLVGVDAKKFKKDFNLGERFFNEIPTTSLIQTSKGYSPTTGFGQVETKKDWGNQIQKLFFEPMDQLNNLVEDFSKLKLEGLEEATVSKQVYDEFTRLNDVLKNNQIALQFRALYSDLEKSFAEGDRVLKEGLSVNQTRRAIDIETSGLMAGTSKGLSNIIDINTFKPDQLSAQQRVAGKDSFKTITGSIQDLDTINESLLNKMDAVVRALSSLDIVEATARGFGAEIKPENMADFIDKVAGPDNLAGVEKLISINNKVDTNTADTVERLDEMLSNMGDPDATERVLEKIASLDINKISNMSTDKIPNVLESLARKREKFEASGNQEGVTTVNKAIDSLSSTLVNRLGFEGAVDAIDNNFVLMSRKFKTQEMAQRAFGAMDTKTVMSKFSEYADKPSGGFLGMFKEPPIAESDDLKKLTKLQKDDGKRSSFSAKNIAKVSATMAVMTALQKSGNGEIVKNLDSQIEQTDKQISEKELYGKATEGDMRKLYIKKEGLVAEREFVKKDAEFYAAVQSMSQLSFVASELAASFGISEENVKKLGVGALGTYSAIKLMSAISGGQLPETAKAFESAIGDVASSLDEKGKPSTTALRGFKKTAEAFEKDIKTKTKNALGLGPDDIAKVVDEAKLKETYGKQTNDITKVMENIEKLNANINKPGVSDEEKSGLITNVEKLIAVVASGKAIMPTETEDTSKLIPESLKSLKDFVDKMKNSGTKTDGPDVKPPDDESLRSLYNTIENLKNSGIKNITGEAGNVPYDEAIKNIFSGETMDAGALGKQIAEASGAGPNMLQQAVAAYIAATLSDFTFRRTDDKQNFSTIENRVEDQSKQLGDLLLKYPEAAQKIIDDFKASAENVSKTNDINLVDESKLIDPRKEKAKITAAMQDFGKIIAEEHAKVVKEQIAARAIAAYQIFAEEMKMAIENTWKTIRGSIDKSRIDTSIGQTARLNPSLVGHAGDMTIPLDTKDMSIQQRVFATSNEFVKEAITKYSEANIAMDGMVTGLSDLVAKAREQQNIMNTSTNPEIVDRARAAYESLTGVIEKQTSTINGFAKGMHEFAAASKNLNEFSASLYKLQDALTDITISHLTENVKGYKNAKDTMDKLFGGSHPEARYVPTVAEERLASRQGITVETKADLEKAQLKDKLFNMKDTSTEEYSQVMQQLRDVDAEIERSKYKRDEERATTKLTEQVSPYLTAETDLERLKKRPGISGGEATNVFGYFGNKIRDSIGDKLGVSLSTAAEITDAQVAINKAVSRSTERISKGQAVEELNTSTFSLKNAWELMQGGGIGALDYFKARDRIKETPGELVYRGMDTGAQLDIGSELRDIREDLQGNLQNLTPEMSQMEASITEPIVAELKVIEALLAADSGVKGKDVEKLTENYSKSRGEIRNPAGGVSKEDFLKSITNNKFGGGGNVVGAGGPTSDLIPAYLSNGEYVVNTRAAQQVGYDKLSFINKHGKIPGFAEGGKLEESDEGLLSRTSSYMQSLKDTIRQGREKSISEFGDLATSKESTSANIFKGMRNLGSQALSAIGEVGAGTMSTLTGMAANPVESIKGVGTSTAKIGSSLFKGELGSEFYDATHGVYNANIAKLQDGVKSGAFFVDAAQTAVETAVLAKIGKRVGENASINVASKLEAPNLNSFGMTSSTTTTPNILTKTSSFTPDIIKKTTSAVLNSGETKARMFKVLSEAGGDAFPIAGNINNLIGAYKKGSSLLQAPSLSGVANTAAETVITKADRKKQKHVMAARGGLIQRLAPGGRVDSDFFNEEINYDEIQAKYEARIKQINDELATETEDNMSVKEKMNVVRDFFYEDADRSRATLKEISKIGDDSLGGRIERGIHRFHAESADLLGGISGGAGSAYNVVRHPIDTGVGIVKGAATLVENAATGGIGRGIYDIQHFDYKEGIEDLKKGLEFGDLIKNLKRKVIETGTETVLLAGLGPAAKLSAGLAGTTSIGKIIGAGADVVGSTMSGFGRGILGKGVKVTGLKRGLSKFGESPIENYLSSITQGMSGVKEAVGAPAKGLFGKVAYGANVASKVVSPVAGMAGNILGRGIRGVGSILGGKVGRKIVGGLGAGLDFLKYVGMYPFEQAAKGINKGKAFASPYLNKLNIPNLSGVVGALPKQPGIIGKGAQLLNKLNIPNLSGVVGALPKQPGIIGKGAQLLNKLNIPNLSGVAGALPKQPGMVGKGAQLLNKLNIPNLSGAIPAMPKQQGFFGSKFAAFKKAVGFEDLNLGIDKGVAYEGTVLVKPTLFDKLKGVAKPIIDELKNRAKPVLGKGMNKLNIPDLSGVAGTIVPPDIAGKQVLNKFSVSNLVKSGKTYAKPVVDKLKESRAVKTINEFRNRLKTATNFDDLGLDIDQGKPYAKPVLDRIKDSRVAKVISELKDRFQNRTVAEILPEKRASVLDRIKEYAKTKYESLKSGKNKESIKESLKAAREKVKAMKEKGFYRKGQEQMSFFPELELTPGQKIRARFDNKMADAKATLKEQFGKTKKSPDKIVPKEMGLFTEEKYGVTKEFTSDKYSKRLSDLFSKLGVNPEISEGVVGVTSSLGKGYMEGMMGSGSVFHTVMDIISRSKEAVNVAKQGQYKDAAALMSGGVGKIAGKIVRKRLIDKYSKSINYASGAAKIWSENRGNLKNTSWWIDDFPKIASDEYEKISESYINGAMVDVANVMNKTKVGGAGLPTGVNTLKTIAASFIDPKTNFSSFVKGIVEKVSDNKYADKIKDIAGKFRKNKKALGGPINGPISGPGGPTSDVIPALLSDGEYVVNADSTRKIGPHVMDHINKYGKIPEFAGGGKVYNDSDQPYIEPDLKDYGAENAVAVADYFAKQDQRAKEQKAVWAASEFDQPIKEKTDWTKSNDFYIHKPDYGVENSVAVADYFAKQDELNKYKKSNVDRSEFDQPTKIDYSDQYSPAKDDKDRVIQNAIFERQNKLYAPQIDRSAQYSPNKEDYSDQYSPVKDKSTDSKTSSFWGGVKDLVMSEFKSSDFGGDISKDTKSAYKKATEQGVGKLTQGIIRATSSPIRFAHGLFNDTLGNFSTLKKQGSSLMGGPRGEGGEWTPEQTAESKKLAITAMSINAGSTLGGGTGVANMGKKDMLKDTFNFKEKSFESSVEKLGGVVGAVRWPNGKYNVSDTKTGSSYMVGEDIKAVWARFKEGREAKRLADLARASVVAKDSKIPKFAPGGLVTDADTPDWLLEEQNRNLREKELRDSDTFNYPREEVVYKPIVGEGPPNMVVKSYKTMEDGKEYKRFSNAYTTDVAPGKRDDRIRAFDEIMSAGQVGSVVREDNIKDTNEGKTYSWTDEKASADYWTKVGGMGVNPFDPSFKSSMKLTDEEREKLYVAIGEKPLNVDTIQSNKNLSVLKTLQDEERAKQYGTVSQENKGWLSSFKDLILPEKESNEEKAKQYDPLNQKKRGGWWSSVKNFILPEAHAADVIPSMNKEGKEYEEWRKQQAMVKEEVKYKKGPPAPGLYVKPVDKNVPLPSPGLDWGYKKAEKGREQIKAATAKNIEEGKVVLATDAEDLSKKTQQARDTANEAKRLDAEKGLVGSDRIPCTDRRFIL